MSATASRRRESRLRAVDTQFDGLATISNLQQESLDGFESSGKSVVSGTQLRACIRQACGCNGRFLPILQVATIGKTEGDGR